jgi:multiple sugar transport system substrate-binding protein
MKKVMVFLLILAVFAMGSSPVLTQEAEAPDVDWSALEVEDGAVLTISGWGDETEQQVVIDSIARFNEVFPDVEVNFEPIPNDFQTIMKANIAAGTAADVFYVDIDLMTAFGRTGQLLALDEYMEASGLTRDAYYASLLAMFTYEDATYALPKDMNPLGLVYLPAIFDEAGVDYPTADWTWDDMTSAAEAIYDAIGIHGFCADPNAERWEPVLWQAGGDVVNEDFTEALFNSPEGIVAAEFWTGMVADGYGTTSTDLGVGWCGEALARELVAMAWEGGWMTNYLQIDFPDVEFVIMPLPAGPAGEGNILFTNGFGAKADTDYPVAAAALVLFLTGPENQEAIFQTGFALPTLVHLADHPWFNDHPNELSLVYSAQIATVWYFGPHHGEFGGRIGDALNDVVLGEAEIQDALDEAAEEINEILAGDE